mgnify:CR=1
MHGVTTLHTRDGRLNLAVIPETARVIDEETAAPDLLAACEAIVNAIPFPAPRWYTPEMETSIRAAILKATGGAQ